MSHNPTSSSYQCTLDEETLKKAKEELNEDPKQRLSQIETFREWIKSQPHIKSRLDADFLIRFLRTAKFSQLRAQQILENFWTARSVEGKGAPDWFKDLDPNTKKIQEMIDLGCCLPLPGRDNEGRKVVLYKTGAYDPKLQDFADYMRAGFVASDILLMDEVNQVNGFIVFLDFSEFGTNHVWNWTRDNISKAMRCWQDTYPMRQKGVNFYNTPTVFNALFEIFNFFAKEKMRKRYHFHKDSLDSLYKEIPKRMLPSEYGGDAGPIKDVIEAWKTELSNSREEVLSLGGENGIDESKRVKNETKKDGWGGVLGSFRKLEVE